MAVSRSAQETYGNARSPAREGDALTDSERIEQLERQVSVLRGYLGLVFQVLHEDSIDCKPGFSDKFSMRFNGTCPFGEEDSWSYLT